MSRVSTIKTNWTAGELAKDLYGRVDITKYANGAETLENFIVQPHGGITRRPGTRFVKEVKTSSAKTRLIPFEFSTTQAYCIEFGNLYVRFYKDNGSILEANKTISGATQANPCVVTATSHGYDNGDEIYIASVVGMTELNGKYYKIKNKTTNTFELTDVDDTNINSSAFTAYSSAGTAARVYTVTTTYATADLFNIQFAQSADVLYLTHPSYAPRKLSRTGHTSWTLETITFTDGPYQDENITTTTLTPSHTTGSSRTITASAVAGINGGDGFQTTDVGRIISIGHQAAAWASSTSYAVGDVKRNSGNVYECIKAGTSAGSGGPSGEGDEIVDNSCTWKFLRDGGIQWGFATVTGRTSTTEVTVTVNATFGGTTAETKWRLGAFSDTTGFPTACAFYEQRLFFAGTTEQPQTLFGSKSGDYENHTPGTLDDDPVIYTLATDQVNAIRWLSPGKVMAIGTVGGEFIISGSTTADALTPTNVRVVREGTRGSASHTPIRIDNVVIFIQRQQRKIREFAYLFDSDSYQSPDLTILSNQVAKGGVTEIAYQQEPSTVIWGVKADGQLVGMTYLRDQQVVAWHRHKIGGTSGSCTITVSDYANIAAGTTLTFTKSDGSTVTFTSTTGTAGTDEFRTQTNNNTTADNIYTAINAHADFTVANPAAAVVTVEETTRAGAAPLTVTSSDTARLTTTDQAIAVVESLAIIPSSTTGEEEVWMIVQRTINGVTRRYVEYLSNQFDIEESQEKGDAFFVDSGLSYSSTAASSISGLGHLEGETVSILGDGSVYTKRNVSSGAVTSIDPTVAKAQIGLTQQCTMKTLRPEAGGDDGTAQGKTKRDFEVTLRLIDTLGGKVGPDTSNLDEIIFRTGSDPMDSSPPLFTGDKKVNIRGGWDTAGQMVYTNDEPLPAHITALITRIITHDG
tara:strand:+ start:2003 stop:4753 length:2751 start_codon:yes stop_codon:yes gene_type:complete